MKEHANGDWPAGDARIKKAIRLLRDHPERNWDTRALSRECGLSKSRLHILFSLASGTTVRIYLRRTRLARALRLLSEPTLAIKDVAARCGLPNQSHFGKVFRVAVGITPGRYRELVNRTPRQRPDARNKVRTEQSRDL